MTDTAQTPRSDGARCEKHDRWLVGPDGEGVCPLCTDVLHWYTGVSLVGGGMEHDTDCQGCELERLREARAVLIAYVDAADWYRQCLEGVSGGRVVRGLGEAKAAYESALSKARETVYDEYGAFR